MDKTPRRPRERSRGYKSQSNGGFMATDVKLTIQVPLE